MDLNYSINILLFFIVAVLAASSSGYNGTLLFKPSAQKRAGRESQIPERKIRSTTTTEATATSTVASTTPLISGVVLYKLPGSNGVACIMIQTDALIEFHYKDAYGGSETSDLYVPAAQEISGDCDKSDEANIVISWAGYDWTIYFSKTPGGEHWYASKMELKLDSLGIEHSFKHLRKPPRSVTFSTPQERAMLFPTPVGKAYTCSEEFPVTLKSKDMEALVIFRNSKIQPFIFKRDEFGPEYVCSPGGMKSFRSETAPIAVGSTLAIATLLTVTGYGVYRYMKIKKVQYDTME